MLLHEIGMDVFDVISRVLSKIHREFKNFSLKSHFFSFFQREIDREHTQIEMTTWGVTLGCKLILLFSIYVEIGVGPIVVKAKHKYFIRLCEIRWKHCLCLDVFHIQNTLEIPLS